MANLPEFQQTQYNFAAHIRNPQVNPRPQDVEVRRMKIYNELFYNNAEDFMASSYPVLRAIMSDESWHRLIRSYFHTHKAKTPLFPEMPREFLHYLEHEHQTAEDDLPFMLELAHYEWAELALSLSDQETEPTQLDNETDLLNLVPLLSPLAWLLSYQYPVHQIGPDFIPAAPNEQPSFLLLYRDNDDEVHFMELNSVTARLLQLINEQQKITCKEMLTRIAEELNHPTPATVINGGLQILQDLFSRNVLLAVNKK